MDDSGNKFKLHIDFETYSECDLYKHGAWNYSKHSSTKALCMAYTIGDSVPKLTYDEVLMRELLARWIDDKDIEKYAWNSFFECCIIHNTLGVEIKSFDQWNDVMAWAAASALPQGLGNCAKVFFPKDDNKQKDKEGKSLISKLCLPQRITPLQLLKAEYAPIQHLYEDEYEIAKEYVKNRDYPSDDLALKASNLRVHPKHKHHDYDKLLSQLGDYCKQDVLVEHELSTLIRPLSKTEKKVWVQDQRINWKGVRCDIDLCKKATTIFENTKQEKLDEIAATTKLDNPNSPIQLTDWLRKRIKIDNLQAATLREKLLDPNVPRDIQRVLALRSTSARTPPKKYMTMIDRADPDDERIRGTLTYHGASTGRWASRGINVQNLPRPSLESFESPVNLVLDENEELLELTHGDKIETLCSIIRCALIPSEGNSLVVSDYSSIEARVLAWLADEQEVLDVFRSHGLAYEHAASKIYNVPIEKVNKNQRFIGKTSILACGYQGGKLAFQRMAQAFGVDIPERMAVDIVNKWRDVNPNIVSFWYQLQNKAIDALANKGKAIKVNKHIAFKFVNYKGRPYLLCRLPSGRLLTYVHPKIMAGKYGKKLTYMGVNSVTSQWNRIDTYGGKLAENVTQAVARDILAQAKLNLIGTNYDNIVLSVHDEIICDTPTAVADVDKLSEIMCRVPEWAEGLPIAAEGEVTKRYWK